MHTTHDYLKSELERHDRSLKAFREISIMSVPQPDKNAAEREWRASQEIIVDLVRELLRDDRSAS